MPTTTYQTPTCSASVLAARTDAAGAAVTDWTAEEGRLLASILNPGYLKPSNAFVVAAQSTPDMTVKVGSGTSKADHYVVAGAAAGQGNYLVRLDVVAQNVTISAADASQTRVDEIYLVVRDNGYDSSARVLPQIGYRKGDAGSGNPGPDASWKAYALLARVSVAANATTIVSGAISDQRVASSTLASLLPLGAIGTTISKYSNAVPIGTSFADTPASPSDAIVFSNLVPSAVYKMEVRGGFFNGAGGVTGVEAYIGVTGSGGGYSFANNRVYNHGSTIPLPYDSSSQQCEIDVSVLYIAPASGGVIGFQTRRVGGTGGLIALTAQLSRIA